MNETENIDRWMTVADLADYLQLSRSKIYDMAQKGAIPCSKIAGQWRFKKSSVDAWMEMDKVSGLTSQEIAKT